MLQLAPNQVLLDWGDGRVVVVSVQVIRRDWRAGGPERRLEEVIAEEVWASWHLAALAAAPEYPARERRPRDA